MARARSCRWSADKLLIGPTDDDQRAKKLMKVGGQVFVLSMTGSPVASRGKGTPGGLVFDRIAAKYKHRAGPVESGAKERTGIVRR